MMIKFDQQVLSDHEKGLYGDCLRACVYTLLQKDIELPHPVKGVGEWNFDFFDDLEQKTGKELLFQPREKEHWPEFVIRTGKSPRDIYHAIVWHRLSGTMFHDPHPSRSGLVIFTGWYVLK